MERIEKGQREVVCNRIKRKENDVIVREGCTEQEVGEKWEENVKGGEKRIEKNEPKCKLRDI